jgi:hypothetical protein
MRLSRVNKVFELIPFHFLGQYVLRIFVAPTLLEKKLPSKNPNGISSLRYLVQIYVFFFVFFSSFNKRWFDCVRYVELRTQNGLVLGVCKCHYTSAHRSFQISSPLLYLHGQKGWVEVSLLAIWYKRNTHYVTNFLFERGAHSKFCLPKKVHVRHAFFFAFKQSIWAYIYSNFFRTFNSKANESES